MSNYKIGIDLGGTKTEGILLDSKMNIIKRKRVPTPSNEYNSILEQIKNLILEFEISDTSVGVCAPGAISKKTGLIKNSNTQSLIGKPFKEDLEKKIGHPIILENDANCFAMAEAKLGSGRGFGIVFGIILGTGVGGGIVVNGLLHKGPTNIAGEWGHHRLYPEGNKCYCGKRGCVETYISGPALSRRWLEISGKHARPEQIIKKLNTDEGRIWKKEFLENFGVSLANVIDILDPDAIVLGGGLSNIPFLYDEGKYSVYENVFSDIVETPILKNTLGDSAGVIGAALLVDDV